jgi:hypothetical protein
MLRAFLSPDTLKISFSTFHLLLTEKHGEREYDGTPSRKKDGISPKQKQLKNENGGKHVFVAAKC